MTSMSDKPRYTVRPVTTPVSGRSGKTDESACTNDNASGGRVQDRIIDPFLRPAAEDDDGYDPFSDRPPAPEPTFQEDPWS